MKKIALLIIKLADYTKRKLYRYVKKENNTTNDFSEFEQKSRSFWGNYYKNTHWNNKNVVLCENNPNSFLGLGVVLFALVVAKVKNAKVIVFNEHSNAQNLWFLKPFDLIFANYEKIKNDKSLQIEKEANNIYEKLNSPSDILNVEYAKVPIGDLIYDEILRSPKSWKARVDYIDRNTLFKIKEALTIIFTIDELEKKYNIVSACFSHTVGFKIGGLPLRYLAYKGKEVYCGRFGLRSIKKYNNPVWLSPLPEPDEYIVYQIFDNKEFYSKVLEKGNKFLDSRFKGTAKDSDSKRAYANSKKILNTKKDFCEEFDLDQSKPVVFVMLHAFNDFPHHYENILFDDYYDWFENTLIEAQKNKDVNWIFKEHPTSEHYPNDANFLGLSKICTQKNIVFLDRNYSLNNAGLFNFVSGVITCVGTAGLEFGSQGVPTLLAGQSSYTNYGIGYFPKTKEEYLKKIRTLNKEWNFEPQSDAYKEKSVILFYLIYNFYTFRNNYNNRFVPLHNIDIAIKNNHNYIIDFYLKEIDDSSIHDFLNRIETYINTKNKQVFLEISDILE